jgi:hypothetical protein
MRFAVEHSKSEAIAADDATLDAKARRFSESIKVVSCNVSTPATCYNIFFKLKTFSHCNCVEIIIHSTTKLFGELRHLLH